MKKRLHFITFIIGVAFSFSILNSDAFLSLKESFMQSKVDVAYQSDNSTDELINMNVEINELVYLTLEPSDSYTMPDKLLNNKNGKMLPARINSATIKVPMEGRNVSSMICLFLCLALIISGFIMAVYNFFKIISAVSKSVIFEWINVKRLRRMGIGFISMFIFDAILTFVQKFTVLELIEIENYRIITSPFDGGTLMYGIISFLVAEIFAVGLKLKEEQELTI